jgi:4-methyl-5(b-hydroxyethyl)-thiazole monophosphate biosynthesis
MSKTVLFAVSKGTESMEFSCPYDILKRAGAKITIAKVKSEPNDKSNTIITAQGLEIKVDNFIEDVKNNKYDLIVCPGGLPNGEILGKNETLVSMLKQQKKENRLISAICASPYFVFEKNGLLEGEKGTCYPSLQKDLKNKEKINDRVVVSNNCITSQGPCTAVEFGYVLCEKLFGAQKSDQLKQEMVFKN